MPILGVKNAKIGGEKQFFIQMPPKSFGDLSLTKFAAFTYVFCGVGGGIAKIHKKILVAPSAPQNHFGVSHDQNLHILEVKMPY